MGNDRRTSAEQHSAEQAAANAAISGIRLDDDERALVERRRSGELTQDEFVGLVVELAKSRPPASAQELAALEMQSFRRVDDSPQADADAMTSRLAAIGESLRDFHGDAEERS